MSSRVETLFDSWWAAHLWGLPPAAHVLRQKLQNRWLRIHSLPGGKRYPTSAADRIELLFRHERVASTVLGDDAPCAVVLGGFAESAGPVDPASCALLPELGFTRALAHNPEWFRIDEADYLTASVALSAWSFPRFDEFLLTVADDRVGLVVFVSFRTGQIYAPYDGGADLFLASESRRDELKATWSDWILTHPLSL